MNKEEKKAIHYFDNKIGDFELLYGKKITTQENEYLKLLLNLISKQQKEIEDLKTITREYEAYKCGEDDTIVLASKEYFIDGFFKDFLNDYISKDKIKEKIEELKNRKIGASTGIYAVQVDILEELLGE